MSVCVLTPCGGGHEGNGKASLGIEAARPQHLHFHTSPSNQIVLNSHSHLIEEVEPFSEPKVRIILIK